MYLGRTIIGIVLIQSILIGCDKYSFDENNQTQPNTPNIKAEVIEPTPTTIPEPPKPQIQKISFKELSDNMKVQVQPSTEEEKYIIYFSWPLIQENKKIRIRRDQILSIVEPLQTTFSHEVSHNQILNYTFDVLDETAKIDTSFSKQVKIPRDFVVREGQNQILENPLNVNRFFMHNVPLQTFGAEINIKANEFFANDGVIETFPENSKAPFNTQGRSGGNITLTFATAVGKLKVFMRGENGGDGTNGSPFESRAKDGASAGPGQGDCDVGGGRRLGFGGGGGGGIISLVAADGNGSGNMKTSHITDGGNGGGGGVSPLGGNSGGGGFRPEKITPNSCWCESMGANAGNGENGAQGRQGNPAKDGGDSGNLKISVIDGNAFDVFVNKSFGVAGNPGLGGEGQDGGLGGGKTNSKCSGNAGSNGAKGPIGLPGQTAQNGKLGTACVYIGSTGKNDCF